MFEKVSFCVFISFYLKCALISFLLLFIVIILASNYVFAVFKAAVLIDLSTNNQDRIRERHVFVYKCFMSLLEQP